MATYSNITPLFLLHLWGGIEPILLGPFLSEKERDVEAKNIYFSENFSIESDTLLKVNGVASFETYPGSFFQEFEEIEIEGIPHCINYTFDWHGKEKLEGRHPLGTVYIDGENGYVQSRYNWLSFPLSYLPKLNT